MASYTKDENGDLILTHRTKIAGRDDQADLPETKKPAKPKAKAKAKAKTED